MKQFVQYFLIPFTFFVFQQHVFGQVYSAPIYASVAVEKTYIKPSDKVVKINTTEVYEQIASQIREKVKFPYEESIYRNQLQILLELDIDRSGHVKSTRVHNTKNKNLIKNIQQTLARLEIETPFLPSVENKTETFSIPITFQF